MNATTTIRFEMSDSLKNIFIKDIINILAVGTGKTHSCGKAIIERLKSKSNDLLIVSTMSNSLIDGIVAEVMKCIDMYCNPSELLLTQIKNNSSKVLRTLGIMILNNKNPLRERDLKYARVIITNHAYFFSHGHDNNYNNNCYKLQSFLKAHEKRVTCIFDEFDQFHKMGLEILNLNYYVGHNFVDPNRKQRYIVDTAFRYCHKKFIERSHKNCEDDNFEDDFYYKLPEECYSKKLESNKDGIKYFMDSLDGSYDFKTVILNNLDEIIDKQYIYCGKHGKKVGNYTFRRYDEIVRCKLNSDVFQDESITSKFLKINSSIILITQKIEVEAKDGEILKLETRKDVIEFAKKNLTKKNWINFYSTIAAEGKKLYITRMVMRKQQFNFNNCDNYYLTATPGILKKLGYTVKTDNQFTTPCKIKEMDLFIIPNKSNSKSDMELFFNELKDSSLETVAIANKKDVVDEFIDINKSNELFSNVNPVLKDVNYDIGREPSQSKRPFKNVTYIYQKGNQTQGTNYSDHVLLLQDCHIKVDIIERIVPSGDGLEVIDYMDAAKKSITQSALRTLRGSLKYKAIGLFCSDEEMDLVYYLQNYLKNYNIKCNLIYVKEVKNLNDRKVVISSIVKHIQTRHEYINFGEGINLYTYDNNSLFTSKKSQYYEVVQFYSDLIKNNYSKIDAKNKTMHEFKIDRKKLFNYLNK